MSGTPPFPPYFFNGTDGLDYTSQLIGETSNALGSYRQKLDPAINSQILPDMSSRSDHSSSGRDDTRYSRSADEINYKMVGEAIKTRDMNRLGLDTEYKGRDNGTPLNMVHTNGDYLRNYAPEAMRNLAHTKQKDQASLYADYYSAQGRLSQPQLPITALNPFLQRSRAAQSFNPLFTSYLPSIPFPSADISTYNVDRRTPLPQNYRLPPHIGASVTNLSYQDQEPARSYLGTNFGQLYNPYSSSPAKLQRKYNESISWSQMNNYNHGSTSYTQSTNPVSSIHSDISNTINPAKTYTGSNVAKNTASRTGDTSVIDLTNSNSPDAQPAPDTPSKAKGVPPPLVHTLDKVSRENGLYTQRESGRNSEYGQNYSRKTHANSCQTPAVSSPNLDQLMTFPASHLNHRESSYGSNIYDTARTNDPLRSKLLQNSVEHPMLKLGSSWPSAGYHTPPPQYPSSDSVKQSGSPSAGFKSKHLPRVGSDLTFNYPEGVSAKPDRLQQAVKYSIGSGSENGFFSKGRTWPRKDESKLSDLEHKIMDTAREGKLPSNLMQSKYDKSATLSNHLRPLPLHHALANHLTTPRVHSEYSDTDLLKIEKLKENATSPSRNTVIQSVPKLPQGDEIANVPCDVRQSGQKYDTVNASNNKPLPNEGQKMVHFDGTTGKEMTNGIGETLQTTNTPEKMSPSKPGRKRKLSKIKDLEQRPKRKYTKKSEIWKKREEASKMKNSKNQTMSVADSESEQRKEELVVSEIEPRRSDDKEPVTQATPEPAPIEKNMRRQRKSGDMEEYLYGWTTDEDIENDDSSDEDYSCPTQVNKYKVKASTKPRSTRRTASMRSDDASFTEDQYSSNNEEKYDRRKKDLRGKKRWKKEKNLKTKSGKKIGRPKSEKNLVSKSDESLNDDNAKTDVVQTELLCENENKLLENEDAKIPDTTTNIEQVGDPNTTEVHNEQENDSDIKKISDEMKAANTSESQSTAICEEEKNLVEIDNASAESEVHNKAPILDAKQSMENKKIEGNEEAPVVRTKRKYTRRLGEDGLPIKRAKRTKQKTEDKPNEGTPRIKRKYRKLSAKWNKAVSGTEKNGIISDRNDVKIPSEISPALIELYTSNRVEDLENRHDEELSSLHKDLQKTNEDIPSNEISLCERKTTAQNHPDTNALIDDVPSEGNNKSDDSCKNPDSINKTESVQNTQNIDDAATQLNNSEVPLKIRKKPGRKPGWKKLQQNEEAASTNTQPNVIKRLITSVKKKYKKPKGDGLPRFGMRKRGRKLKHKLLKSNALIPPAASSSGEPSQRPNKIPHISHRKYTLSKTGKKLGRPCTKNKNITTNNLMHKIIQEPGSSQSSTEKKFDVHKISEELQSQEYDYNFSTGLTLSNGDVSDDDDEKPADIQESENASHPSSPPPCQSRPQTPLGSLTPLMQSPFPTHLKKLCCNSAIGETPLHKAARNGLIENLQYYLETGTRANQSDNAGYTALHEACVHNHKGIATMLLQYGSDVNKNAEDGTRPLHDAVEYDHLEMARLMLAAGADHMLSKYSGRAIPNMIRSKKMGRFIHAYFKELQEKLEEDTKHDRELDWIIPCSAVFDKAASHCYSVLDDPPELNSNEHFIDFELFDDFPVNTYLLQPDEETERSNYCLLDDYLRMTQRKGNHGTCNSIRVITISTEKFKSQIQENQAKLICIIIRPEIFLFTMVSHCVNLRHSNFITNSKVLSEWDAILFNASTQVQNAVLSKNSTLDLSGNVIELVAVGSDFADATGADTFRIDVFKENIVEAKLHSFNVKEEPIPAILPVKIESSLPSLDSDKSECHGESLQSETKLDTTNTSTEKLSDHCDNIPDVKPDAMQCTSSDSDDKKQDALLVKEHDTKMASDKEEPNFNKKELSDKLDHNSTSDSSELPTSN